MSYKARPTAKDFIQVEVVVEKNSQKIILIGKVNGSNSRVSRHIDSLLMGSKEVVIFFAGIIL